MLEKKTALRIESHVQKILCSIESVCYLLLCGQ